MESVRAELGDFEATATRSIEVIATEQSAQAVQIQHLGVELDGKASADYVEEISARVDVTEQGIEAFTGQLQSVKAEVDSKASAQVVEGMEARVVQDRKRPDPSIGEGVLECHRQQWWRAADRRHGHREQRSGRKHPLLQQHVRGDLARSQ
ncbi:hypothetical protein ACE0DR_28650 [Azotobacter sp. CWF10]